MLFDQKTMRPLKVGLFALLVVVGIFQIKGLISYGIKFPVLPISDFSDYWSAAGDIRQYVKGGALLLLYWPLKAMGWAPSTCAVILHTLCYVMAFSITVHFAIFSVRENVLFRLLALVPFLLWVLIWTPLVATVEVMIVHSCFLLSGLQLLFLSKSQTTNYIGLLLLFLAFSMRAQAMFIFSIVILVFHIFSWLFPVQRSFLHKIRLLIPCLLLAVASEAILHHGSVRNSVAKYHQRTPFYAGFVEADPNKPADCGSWSLAAETAARRDVDIPLIKVFVHALQEKGFGQTTAIALCKLRRALYRDEGTSAVWWTYAYYYERSPSSHLIEQIEKHARAEVKFVKWYRWIELFLFVGVVAMSLLQRRQRNRNALGVLLFVTALFIGHAVIFSLFEFNPRYLIPAFGLFSVSFLLFGHDVVLTSTNSPKPKSVG